MDSEIPAGQSHFQRLYTKRSPLGYGRPRRAVASGLRLRQPRRVIVPLTAEEVSKFWCSFRTFRDLALVGLMLLDGLRSCEVLALQLEDLQLADRAICASSAKVTKARVAAARGDRRGAGELCAGGTTANPFPCPVRLLERPAARTAVESRRIALPISSSPRAQPREPRQPPPDSSYFRRRYGASRSLAARPPTPDGTCRRFTQPCFTSNSLAQDVWREYARAVRNRTRLPTVPIL